jgi:hypothetical protein
MSFNNLMPDVSEGNAEPAASRVIIVIMAVGLIGLLAMFSNIFGWDQIPLISSIIPLMGNLGASGIWYYLIGIMIGSVWIIANLIVGVLSD